MTSCSLWLSLTLPWKKASPWMEKWVQGLTDVFLLCFFFSFLPSRCTLMENFTPSSIIPFSLFISFLSPVFFFVFSSPFPLHCSCVPVTMPSAPAHSFWVTAVHSPVPYCGAVHHLHAFSILQQNEFLIGPEREERGAGRGGDSFKPLSLYAWWHVPV